MSTAYIGHSGAYQSATVEVLMFRWGGGAAPGKWHVCLLGLARHDWYVVGIKCVVDDFGMLVQVPQ